MNYKTNTLISVVSTAAGSFSGCYSIALDVSNNKYYVANRGNSTISILTAYYF
jgi:DNA-binding beta-propeller fold protein YncE